VAPRQRPCDGMSPDFKEVSAGRAARDGKSFVSPGVYVCEFLDNGRQMFSSDLVRGALRDVPPLKL
jgi:hypothetical protein